MSTSTRLEQSSTSPGKPVLVTRVYNNGDRVAEWLSNEDAEDLLDYNVKYRGGCAHFRNAECVHEGYLGPERCAVIAAELAEKLQSSKPMSGRITNTTDQSPAFHFAVRATPGGIEAQESQGQQELVNAEVLPAKGDWTQLEALGVKRGAHVTGDPLFVHVELPAGWKKQATDHSLWTDLVDETGTKRASIFYKAAFYDRDAFFRVSA